MTAGQGFGLDSDNTAHDRAVAFQPIVDLQAKAVWGYEASAWPARTGLAAGVVPTAPRLDRCTRHKAVAAAASLYEGRPYRLTIGVEPGAADLQPLLDAIELAGLTPDQLLFEFADAAPNGKPTGITSLVEARRACAHTTSSPPRPDLIRIGALLVRDIHRDTARQRVVAEITMIARDQDIRVLAGGVERIDEVFVLRAAGISLMQGPHFAKPMAGGLPRLEFEPFDPLAHQRAAS